MKKRIAVISMFVALAALLLATVPAASPALTLNSYEQQLVQAINRQRAKHGLMKVRVHARLVTAARSHSADMGQHKYFQHNSSSGETWNARILRYGYTNSGYRMWRAGENIYYGGGLYSSPILVVRAWMKSTMHRAVILTKAFRDIGVGAVKCSAGYGNWGGPVWFFTLDLGRRIK